MTLTQELTLAHTLIIERIAILTDICVQLEQRDPGSFTIGLSREVLTLLTLYLVDLVGTPMMNYGNPLLTYGGITTKTERNIPFIA